MFLSDGNTTVLLDTKDSKLASKVRRHLIKLYFDNKGPGKTGWKSGQSAQHKWIQEQDWSVKGLIVFMNDEPIYTLKKGSERVTSAWFQNNVAAVHRIRSEKSLDKAEASLNEFATVYNPGSITNWFLEQVTVAREAVDSRRAQLVA
jgi:hypothetical protein